MVVFILQSVAVRNMLETVASHLNRWCPLNQDLTVTYYNGKEIVAKIEEKKELNRHGSLN